MLYLILLTAYKDT